MFTIEICQYISDMTNKYAESVMSKKKLKPNSRMKRWKPIIYAAVALYQVIVWEPS